jgi:hypothetical protein
MGMKGISNEGRSAECGMRLKTDDAGRMSDEERGTIW